MFFDEINEAPPDPIFGLSQAFKADTRVKKINLVVGIYKDEQGRAELFSSSRMAQKNILDQDLVADYLPIDGLSEMTEKLGSLVFGDPLWKEHHGRIYASHTTGGTGALRIGAEFLVQEIGKSFYIPNHSWPNHRSILEKAGAQCQTYPYYNREKRGFDCETMCAFLQKLPEKSVVILHACCHNPTGCDPTLSEWGAISKIMKEKKLLPFFDFAYQGLGEGLDEDAQSVRLFMEEGHEMLIGYSCSKNFSMYCQRVGALFIVDKNPAVKLRIGSQVRRIIRALYSNPPAHGARIVAEVLKNPDLKTLWHKNLTAVRERINSMRQVLIQGLIDRGQGIDFEYLKVHKGMFSFIDMDKSQAQRMISEFAIYITDNGRISIPGLTLQNIDDVINALVSVCAN